MKGGGGEWHGGQRGRCFSSQGCRNLEEDWNLTKQGGGGCWESYYMGGVGVIF